MSLPVSPPSRPLSSWILRGSSIVLLALSLLLTVLTHLFHQKEARHDQIRQLQQTTTRIGASLLPYLALLPDPGPMRNSPLTLRLDKHIQDLAFWTGLVEISLLDGDGTVLYSTNSGLRASPAPLLEDLQGISGSLPAPDPQDGLSPVFSLPLERQTFRLFQQVFAGPQHSQQGILLSVASPLPQNQTPVTAILVFRLPPDYSLLPHTLLTALSLATLAAAALLILLARHRDHRQTLDRLETELLARDEAGHAQRRLQDLMEQTIIQRTRRLRDSESRFRDFAMSSSDWLWETDVQNRFTYVSDGIRRLLGLDPDQIIGKTRSELQAIPYEETQRWETYLATLRARRPFRNFTYRILSGDGQERIHSISGAPVFDSEGTFCGYRGSGTDITDQYRAMKALVESEDRYRSVADLSLDALLVHLDGRIIFVNHQAVTTAHADSDLDLIGKPITDFVPETSLPALYEQFQQVNDRQQRSERREIRLKRLDGTPFEAEVGSAPIIYDGKPAILTLLRDITTRKTVQTQLIQTAKLATLGEMAAGMAHELSQPMNVIRMAAEGALLTDGKTLPERVRKGLDIIAGQAGRMGDIIDHMRVFSRKQAPTADLFDPQLCIRESINMVEVQFYAETITITARYPNQPTLVFGQPVHLEQVLLNLLTNARDSLRTRGRREAEDSPWRATIDLRARVDTVSDMLLIEVADSGTGLSADTIDRIFEPFYTTKEVGSGTGLGLSVSFGLISAMGGSISAHNSDAGGAVFVVSLPLARANDQLLPVQADTASALPSGSARPGQCPPLSPSPIDQKPGGTPGDGESSEEDSDEPSALVGHILVVDDEPAAALLIRDHLLTLGYRITTASDGAKAYDLFLEDPPDLLITDLRMPQVGGLELIERIHRHIPDLPVIIMTGHMGQSDLTPEEIEAKAAAVLRKPIRLAELVRLVIRHMPQELAPPLSLPDTDTDTDTDPVPDTSSEIGSDIGSGRKENGTNPHRDEGIL